MASKSGTLEELRSLRDELSDVRRAQAKGRAVAGNGSSLAPNAGSPPGGGRRAG